MRSVLAGIRLSTENFATAKRYERQRWAPLLNRFAVAYYFCGEACGVGVGEGFAKTIGAVAMIPFPS